VVTVAPPDEEVPAALAAAYHGRLRARLRTRWPAKDEGPIYRRSYVAGPPPMVDASLRLLLREARLASSDIRYDKFS
jgi:hypothetical protein